MFEYLLMKRQVKRAVLTPRGSSEVDQLAPGALPLPLQEAWEGVGGERASGRVSGAGGQAGWVGSL